MITSEFSTPLFLAIVWTTLGCGVIRLRWRTTYDWVCAFWLLTVFSFTFFNRIVVLHYFAWPGFILVSALALLAPIITNFSYSATCEDADYKERWPAMLYGLILLGASVVLSQAAGRICTDVQTLSNHSVGQIGCVVVILVIVGVGMTGFFIVFRARKSHL
jgi:hypothetical protein